MITIHPAPSPRPARLTDEAVYLNMKQKLNRTLSFCTSCREAWQTDDLDEMIRRRDRLAADLQMHS